MSSAVTLDQIGASRRGTDARQTSFLQEPIPSNWERLSSKDLLLNESQYGLIRDCYREVYETFLPGPNAKAFFTQVAELITYRGLKLTQRQVINLAKRAREFDIPDFPELRDRTVSSSSGAAKRLRPPAGPRLSLKEHNAFARIYRDLQRERFPQKKKGGGFYEAAAQRMKAAGLEVDVVTLRNYASYRRRLGDVNFPRLRGSHEYDRMHVAALDRIQSLGVMATGLMHEILQPLQVILAAAELQKKELETESVDPKKCGERLDQIVAQVEKLNQVVQHVRTIARAGEPKIGPVRLHDAINNVLLLFLSQLRGKGIDVRVDAGEDLPPIVADTVGVERIFINLLTNARDAIDETGRGEGAIRITARAGADNIVCEVIDDGAGIAEGDLSRIFDPYVTTKELGKGTGLGLTEVMNLMIQFGGQVTVQSEPGQGATFRLEFRKHVEGS